MKKRCGKCQQAGTIRLSPAPLRDENLQGCFVLQHHEATITQSVACLHSKLRMNALAQGMQRCGGVRMCTSRLLEE